MAKLKTLLILLAPLPGILCAVFFSQMHGIQPSKFLSSFIGVAIGIPLALIIGSRSSVLFQRSFLLSTVGLFLLFASLFFPGLDGVRRWLPCGPLQLNVSMAVAPAILFGLNTLSRNKLYLSWFLVIGTTIAHALQPDGGQAASFSAAVIVFFLLSQDLPKKMRIAGVASAIAATAVAWLRKDQLPAVEYVERILHLIADNGIVGVLATIICIIALFAPILLVVVQSRRLDTREWVLALGFLGYLAVQFVVTKFGNFPVPIFGAGAAPIIGWYLIVGFTSLSSLNRRSQ